MSPLRQWLLLLACAVTGAVLAYGYMHSQAGCKALTVRADISARAAELCTGELVACQMSFEEVAGVIADRHRANEACK